MIDKEMAEDWIRELQKLQDLKKKSDTQLTKAKKIITGLLAILYLTATDEYDFEKACPYQYKEAKDFLEG